ncbi:methyltransferase [Mesorhizobium sp. STM 4661]|uniref:methyltransferase n=1 Tax=Mesorhizobium sp. STM 4661 TaxID=1297570 RepID=UPI001FCB701E|nr:methyltransferase [Mesorhizobium sp. STM 4661]
MGLDLNIRNDVFAPDVDDETGNPFHRAVEAEVKPGERVLDMGTGSGVSGILAARKGARVVAVDINPNAIECARQNADHNNVADRITFAVSDIFDEVEGDFDLIVFDPPFRWFKPRDMLEASTADEDYRGLTRFINETKDRLRSNGRVLLNFATSADIDYLHSLIDTAGLQKKATQYGELTKGDFTARYYIIRLTRRWAPISARRRGSTSLARPT